VKPAGKRTCQRGALGSGKALALKAKPATKSAVKINFIWFSPSIYKNTGPLPGRELKDSELDWTYVPNCAAILFMEQGRNPCLNCGACCAHFRVQFYWREANPADSPNPVPAGMWEDLTADLRCMAGTNAKHRPSCAGLSGRIGVNAKCSIYSSRPTPCRAFTASWAFGKRNERCDEARRAHGLRPLRPEDWASPSPQAEVMR
jgi:Fe-S-cluster containining protein